VYKLYRVSAIVRLTGNVEGSVWISFSEPVACALAGALSGERFKVLDSNCKDALLEIANMIVGASKRKIAERPLDVSMPVMQATEEIASPNNTAVILLPFDPSFGRFIIEFALADRRPSAVAA